MATRAHLKTHTRNALGIALVVFSALSLALLLRPSGVAATPPAPTSPTPTSAAPQAAPPSATRATSAQPAPAGSALPLKPEITQQAPPVDLTRATVVFATMPPATATVTWGRKSLGKITPGKPLVVVRPRDSGPLDVMVRATGYFPVQTRGHTFSDNRVMVKLTPLENESELLGYRAPLDAGVETQEETAAINALGGADGGVVQDGTTFRMVPATPNPSPLLMP